MAFVLAIILAFGYVGIRSYMYMYYGSPCPDICYWFCLTVSAGEPGLSSQVLSPQSNPGASPGWRIGE